MSRIRVTINYVDLAVSIAEAKKAIHKLEETLDGYTKQHDTEFLKHDGEHITTNSAN